MSVFSAIPKRIVEESQVILHLRQTGAYHLLTGAIGLIHVGVSLACAWAWLYLTYAIFFVVTGATIGLQVAVLSVGLPTLLFCVWAVVAGVLLIARFEDIKFDAMSRAVTYRVARFPLLGKGLWTKQLHFSHLAEIQVLPTPNGNWNVLLMPKEGESLGVDFLSIKEDACALAQKIASFCDIPWRVVEQR